MNKYLKLFLLLTTVIFLCISLASCDINSILGGNQNNGNSNENSGNNGNESEGNGNNTNGNGENEIPQLNLYGITFSDKLYTYDGNSHSITIAGKLQDGVSVKYTGNEQTEAGSYTATASFYYGDHYYEGKDMTATLTIKKAMLDMSGVEFNDKTVTYNGAEHSVAVKNLPSGVSVSYENNNKTNAGTYTVTANFALESKNYFVPASMTAKLIISKANYDMSEVVFNGKTVTYNGEAHYLEALNLPDGVSVSYKSNGKTDVGEYTVKATFSGDSDNYTTIPSLEATLTIEKAYYNTDSIVFEDKTVFYDGNPQSIYATGLPEGVTASYNGNGKTNVGTYTVTASFLGDYNNYYEIEDVSATLTIVRSGIEGLNITFPDGTYTYDGKAKSIKVSGTVPKGITVTYEGNGQINAGTYTVTAHFASDNYDAIPSLTATLKINKATVDMSTIKFENLITTYDGTEKNITVSGKLPVGVTVNYVGNGQINAGSYTVTANFNYDTNNYNEISDKTATLVINKAFFDSSKLTFNDKEVVYNGEAQNIDLLGNIPADIEYKIVGKDKIAAGTYTVYVYFTVKEPYNYTSVDTISAQLTIKAPASTSEGLLFNEISDGKYEIIGYNGNDSAVIIPSEYNGKKIVSIASSAFKSNEIITYVYIPSSIINIGNSAFRDCTALENITIESGVKTIGSLAFDNTALCEVIIPDTVETIGQGAFRETNLTSVTLPFVGGSAHSSNGYLSFIFGASSYAAKDFIPTTLKYVTLSNSCAKIPDYAFYGCEGIESIILGNKINSIGLAAFNGCTSLNSIYLPASVKTVLANALTSNSPFFGCKDDFAIVLEQAVTDKFGQFWCNISSDKKALVFYMKSYDDYMKNLENYKTANPNDADLSGIIIGDKLIEGFSPNVYEYTADVDINSPLPEVYAAPSSSSATLIITDAQNNNGVLVIKVISADGENTKEYKITFNTVGTLTTSSKVVLKDGKSGTVTYVIDDGLQKTANNCYAYTAKYDNLVFSFALKVQDLATLITAYDTNTGKYYYVMEDGKYTYNVNSSNLEYWQGIIDGQNGLMSEIVSHTWTHAYWGYNDEGGTFEYLTDANSTNKYGTINLPVGSASKEVYASKQIIEDLFGTGGLGVISPGIATNRSDKYGDNGVFYPTCMTIYKNLIAQAVENGDIITTRNTFTAKSLMDNGVTYYYELADKKNRIDIPSYMIYDNTSTNGSSYSYFETEWKLYIDKAKENQGWAIFCIHNIANSYYAISDAEANKLFAYTDNDDTWVATFTDASLYYCEWSTAKVSTVYVDDELKVTLTDEENDEIFNMPLTVEVKVPATWGCAFANGNYYEIRNNGSYNYILIDIVPDSGTVTISRG